MKTSRAALAAASKNPRHDAFRRFMKDIPAVVSAVVLISIVLCCLIMPIFYTQSPTKIHVDLVKSGPVPGHPMGMDSMGRDFLARMLHGGRVTLRLAFSAVLYAAVIGTVLGILSGYFGGLFDMIVMRITDALAAIPTILLITVIECALGWGQGYFRYAMALSFLPPFIKVLRASVMEIMSSEYIEAARALGVRNFGIIRRHVLRNVLSPLIVQLSNTAAESFTLCTIVGYLGIGVNPPTPEWGRLVQGGFNFFRNVTWVSLAPGLTIIVMVLCLNLIGNGLRDALDPNANHL